MNGKRDAGIAISTSSCEMIVDKVTGTVVDFRFTGNCLHPWHDVLLGMELYRRKGGIRVTDELTGVRYIDDFGTVWSYYSEPRKTYAFPRGTPCTVTDVASSSADGATGLSFSKNFEAAPFSTVHTFTADNTEIRWDVEFRLNPGEALRSLVIEFVLPMPSEPMTRHQDTRPPWFLWAPAPNAPFPSSKSGGWGHSGSTWDIHRFPYSSANSGNGIGVPIITYYSEDWDVGFL